jgi:hypothetical protein
MKALLESAAFAGQRIREQQAKDLIEQGQDLLDEVNSCAEELSDCQQ